jgi:hypothetical protein
MTGRIACVIALAALGACRDIVSFDPPSENVSELPFTPDSDAREMCTQCAADACADERAACLADPRCRRLLECHSQCSDPACRARCGSYATSETPIQSSVHQLHRADESERFSLYSECVAEASCRVACGLGVSWSCLDKKAYRWPTRPERDDDEDIALRVDVVEVNDYLGVRAHVSAYASDGTMLASAQTESWGQAELRLQIVETFDGYLEIEPGVQGFGKQLAYSAPVFRSTRSVHVVFEDNAALPSPQPDTAAIGVVAFDCLGVPASGVTFELEQAVGQPWYTSNGTRPTRNATQTELPGSGGISDIPASYDEVTLVAKRNGDVVARRLVRVRANWLTIVGLAPRTEDE